jgi:hypothetical protein
MASTEFTLDQSLYAFSSGSAASGCHRCCFFFHVVVHQRTTTAPAKITLTVAIAAIWSTRIVRLGSERRELGHRDVDVDCVVVLHTGSTKTESSLIRLVQMHTTFLGRHRWPKELVSGLRRSRQRIEVPTDSRATYGSLDKLKAHVKQRGHIDTRHQLGMNGSDSRGASNGVKATVAAEKGDDEDDDAFGDLLTRLDAAAARKRTSTTASSTSTIASAALAAQPKKRRLKKHVDPDDDVDDKVSGDESDDNEDSDDDDDAAHNALADEQAAATTVVITDLIDASKKKQDTRRGKSKKMQLKIGGSF